ncbi:MAG: ribosome biogenesis GTP-binding protein YihA/YsxC [Candidatus Cloacimonetes bacterium]|nr:ribosome biogenesis GTP-binding protein YihA/YsxC [Candidatus Cloacimonadota bacterium]
MRILESEFITSAVNPGQYPESTCVDIAFCGKSNVGKSSMINTLLNRKTIAKISNTPGKTRLINFFKIRFLHNEQNEGFLNFVDLPGYGYAKVSKTERDSWKTMISSFLEKRFQLRGLIILVDIRHKADPKDILMLELVRRSGIPHAVVATKTDKLKKTVVNQYLQNLKNELGLVDENIYGFSSLKKSGVENVLQWIENRVL